MNIKSTKNIILGASIPLIIATSFYFLNQKTRKPLYTFKDEPTLIFDKNSSLNSIKLIKYDSILVDENVYSVKVILWNDGELPILKSDIRKNFYATLIGGGNIIEYKIINETNPEISQFELNKINNNIKINWNHFDPDFGVELQFLYSGNNDSHIMIKGSVLGNRIKKVYNGNTLTLKNVLSIVGIIIVEWLFLLLIGLDYMDLENQKMQRGFSYFASTVILLTILGSVVYLFLKAWGYRPPL